MGLDMTEIGLIMLLDVPGDLESPGIRIVGVSSSAEEYIESSEILLDIGEELLNSSVAGGETTLLEMGELTEDSLCFWEEYFVLSIEFLLKEFCELVLSWLNCMTW